MIILKTDRSYYGPSCLQYETLAKLENNSIFLRWLQQRARLKNETLYTNIFI